MFILIGLTIRLLDVFAFVKMIEIVENRLLTAIFMWTECVGCQDVNINAGRFVKIWAAMCILG